MMLLMLVCGFGTLEFVKVVPTPLGFVYTFMMLAICLRIAYDFVHAVVTWRNSK